MVQAYGLATPPPVGDQTGWHWQGCPSPKLITVYQPTQTFVKPQTQEKLLDIRPPNYHRQNAPPQAKCLDQALTQNLSQWPTLPGNPPSLKFSQTHPRVGHTLKTLWPRGSTHTGHAHPFAMLWLVAA